MLSIWRHSGFHVFCGTRISPDDETAEPEPLHHPGVILPGKDAVPGSGGKVVYTSRACLGPRSGGRQDKQELPRADKNTDDVLKEMVTLLYSVSGNGNYLMGKGLLKI